MNLDELQSRWEAHDAKLDRLLRLNTRVLQAPALNKAETAVRRLVWWLAIEVVLNLAALVCLGAFIAAHVAEPRFLVPALVLHLSLVLATALATHQIVAIGRLDWSAPVVTIQKQMESLRALRLRAVRWTFMLAPLLWTLFLIVVLEGLFNVDAYAIFPAAWLIGNLLFGVIVLVLALWISRRYASRMQASPTMQRFMRDLAGDNLAAADRFLNAVSQFEEEEARA